MNPLVPEIRTNKLGVPVKKYVRASPAASKGAMKLPAPSLIPSTRKHSDRQLKQRNYSISVVGTRADSRFNRPATTGHNFKFTANDIEVYSVMSATGSANAFELLERGVRSADEARDYLTGMDAGDLIIDRSEFMSEMVNREVPAKAAASAIMLSSIHHHTTDAEFVNLPYAADAIEFSCAVPFKKLGGTAIVLDEILFGKINFSDIKALGFERLKNYNHLWSLRSTFHLLKSGEANFSLDDTSDFIDKAERGGTNNASFSASIHALHYLTAEQIGKFDDIAHFGTAYRKNTGDNKAEAERAYYESLLMETIQKHTNPPSEYWMVFHDEMSLLKEAGVSIDDAVHHISRGLTVHQILSINDGINPSLADGWL